MIALNNEFVYLISNSFINNIDIEDCKSKSFLRILNNDTYSRKLGLFVDFQMKMGYKGKNENEIDADLKEIVSIFRLMTSKLSFQNTHQFHLSQRLLENKSINPDAEQNLILKLQTEQGKPFVEKFTAMYEDFKESDRINYEFLQNFSKNKVNYIKI